MADQFTQYLIIFLVLLLFAKELVWAFAKKRGWINGSNGNYDKDASMKRFDDLDEKILNLEGNHLSHLEEKLDKILELLIRIDEKLK